MKLIETDMLIAVASIGDRYHEKAVNAVKGTYGHLCISPYALVELDLLIQSGKITVKDRHRFHESLAELIDYYDIELLQPRPQYHATASGLRANNAALTFFDSLHAAVVIVEGGEMVSFDGIYDKIEGVKRLKAEGQ